MNTCVPKIFFSNRNISNILEEASPLRDKLMFIVIGARDFSPEITVHLIGTSVFALRATPRQESPVLRQSSSPTNSNLPSTSFKLWDTCEK